MCGIAGIVSATNTDISQPILQKMGRAILHRGPDNEGIWSDMDAGIGLVHRRLAIVDLSEAGHQPFVSSCGRYVVLFNGEIYNHTDLRSCLNSRVFGATQWRGSSDTETLIEGIRVWGFEATLKKAIGMFAIALWDRKKRVLSLARDRLGEKPLYYGWQNGVFLFGSELKALKCHPAFAGEINRNAIPPLLRHNCIGATQSIYQNIVKLTPGTHVQLDFSNGVSGSQVMPTPIPFWSLYETVQNGQKSPFQGTDMDAIDAVHGVLKAAVLRQMQADVPLGAFLSGGIDSTLIAALMQSQTEKPVKTFTIGFEEPAYNEAGYAKAIAKHLKTDHTELYVSSKDAIDIIPKLPTIYDEPFSDSSQIPTFLVAQMTANHVKVALSGDAGDEVFGGYNRYLWAPRVWSKLKHIPTPLRGICAKIITSVDPQGWNKTFDVLSKVSHQKLGVTLPGDKLHKLAGIMDARSQADIYWKLVSHWQSPTDLVLDAQEPVLALQDTSNHPELRSFGETMMYLDSMSYLTDDILTKVDRAAMAVSLETRVPFLDHTVLDLAWSLPMQMKIRDGQGKWILRQILDQYMPRELIERPKMGFGIPLHSWLRGPLRDWAEHLLDETRLRQEGFFNPAQIRQKWDEHLAGNRDWQYQLWDILMFQAWYEEQKES